MAQSLNIFARKTEVPKRCNVTHISNTHTSVVLVSSTFLSVLSLNRGCLYPIVVEFEFIKYL